MNIKEYQDQVDDLHDDLDMLYEEYECEDIDDEEYEYEERRLERKIVEITNKFFDEMAKEMNVDCTKCDNFTLQMITKKLSKNYLDFREMYNIYKILAENFAEKKNDKGEI